MLLTPEKGECSSNKGTLNEYLDTSDSFLTNGYIKVNKDLVYSQEYVEKTPGSPKEDYPPISTNHSKDTEVSQVVDYQGDMMNDPILKRRSEQMEMKLKTNRTRFHILDGIKSSTWAQRI